MAVIAVSAAGAAAEDTRSIRRVEEMNRAAMEDYDILEFDSAKKQLSDALAVVKKAKLDKTKVAARTHMNLGIVYGGGLGDQDTALLEFVSALEIDKDLKLDPAYRSPALQKTFDQARSTTGAGTVEPPVTPPPPAESGLKHNPIEEAPSGAPVLISVRATTEIVDRASQIVLRYRPAGTEAFLSLPMKSGGGAEFQATIPETATRGESVHYFVEAKAATGKVLASAGTVDSPYIISIVKPVSGRPVDEPPDEENPISRQGGGTGSGTGDETGVAKSHPSVHRSFYINVGVGSGLGYVSGETEVSHQAVTCCVAPAPFHVLPEIGFWLSQKLTLSLVGRIGFPLGANVAGAATLAPGGFLRASYVFGRDRGLYVQGGVGAGLIRHTIKLTRTSATANQGDTDTYVSGPLLFSTGTGYILPLGSSGLRFVADLDVIAGIPIVSSLGSGARASKPGMTINGDLSLGIGFAF